MSFQKKVPEWNNAGTEPSATLKASGFVGGYKPPASVFNWFWHSVSEALKELQGASPRDIGALAEEAVYYSSQVEVDIDTATQSLLLVDRVWSKDCPLCKDSGFIFIMQLFFGDPTASTSRTQIAFSYGDGGSNKPKGIALRCYFGGTWSGWTELYGPHNKPTPDDIGAAPESMLARTYSVATFAELDAAINTVLSGMPSHTVREFEISFTAAIQPFGGGTFLSKLYKVGEKYAMVEMRVYATASPKTWVRSLFDGVWKDWVYLSDSSHGHDLSNLTGCLPEAKGGTGKTSMKEVTAGYAIHPVMINCSNLDINELKSAGFYFGHTGMRNAAAPDEISVIEVISYSTDWLLQRQTRLTDGRTWCRYFYSGTSWSEWYRIYTSKDKPTLDEMNGVLGINKGGTGTTGWHQALTNLRAMERQAVYYQLSLNPDIDKLTDSLMLIPHECSKNCPVGGVFVYIMQLFYADITATCNRTQVAFPYMVDGVIGNGIAVRSFNNGTWTEWQAIQSAVESTTYSGCYYRTVNGEREWINPPMSEGVEYRTTKRYCGKPVYTKLVRFSNIPGDGFDRTVAFADDAFITIVSLQGIVTDDTNENAWPLPRFNENGEIMMWASFDYLGAGACVTIHTKGEFLSQRVLLAVEYVKEFL